MNLLVVIVTIVALAWFILHGQWVGAIGAFVAWGLYEHIRTRHKRVQRDEENRQTRMERETQRNLKQAEEDCRNRELQHERDALEKSQENERNGLITNNADYRTMGDLFSSKRHLFSVVNRDYSDLRDALERRNWQSADILTLMHIRHLIHHGDFEKYTGRFDLWDDSIPILAEELEYIPLADLVTMDRLWSQFSDGQYGFSVQLKLCAGAGDDFGAFRTLVGWDKDPDYSGNAPQGHLPSGLTYYRGGVILVRAETGQRTRTERVEKKPETPYDPDWYEDRLALRHRKDDGWTFDPIRKDWYRTAVERYVVAPEQGDPSRGFRALMNHMKNDWPSA